MTIRAQTRRGWSPGAVAYHVRKEMPRGVEVSARELVFFDTVEVALRVPWWRVGLRRRKHGLMLVACELVAEVPAGQMVKVRWE